MPKTLTRDRDTTWGTQTKDPTITRCAIYTRVSTEEGLNQELTSLDVQRVASESFIRSQGSEGWICLPEHYDDGGFSGGNMDRPALQKLLRDIEEEEVDCIVVHRLDRFSRSLMDFSRMMDTLDEHGVSFVSVTQPLNTKTSMGRLTLHMLLSFAQFEREIIAERTRDKISATRKLGKWTGGIPVLGYDIDRLGGKIHVNLDEAERVRTIFNLYLEFGSLIPVVREVDRRGWTNKRWVAKKGGKLCGGKPITKNVLFHMLTNVIYLGKVKYKDETYEGEHEGIVEKEIWDAVQERLHRNGRTGGPEIRNKYGALLRGILRCKACNTGMAHTYTNRGVKKYRYYVCANAQKRGWETCPTKSVAAQKIEDAVVRHIRGAAHDPRVIQAALSAAREQGNERIDELKAERLSIRRSLIRAGKRTEELVEIPARKDETEEAANTRMMLELDNLHDQIEKLEARSRELDKEIKGVEAQCIDEADLVGTVPLFDPIWDEMPPRERERFIRLLIDHVEYDGRDGNVTVHFRSEGTEGVCQESEVSEWADE